MKFRKSIVLPLILINVGIYILQVALGGAFTNLFTVKRLDIIYAPWTLITSMFLHGSIWHIAINMWVLYMFGTLLESKIGTKRFILIYFISGILASIASNFVYDAALGASGAIMGVLGVCIILMPDLRVMLMFPPIPMSLQTAGILIAALDIFGLLPGVAHAAHLGGLATGLVYGWMLKKKKHKFQKRFESKTRMNSDDVDEYIRSGRI